MRNHYELLQIFPRATQDEVKDAFRFLLFRYHPDHNRGREEWAVERTMELVEAYHTLSNPARRAHYDVLRGAKVRAELPKKGFSLFGSGATKAKQVAAIFSDGVDKYKTDEFESAIKAFRQVLTLEPDFPNVKYNLSLAFLALERYPEALQWLQEHVGKNKEDQEARALHTKAARRATRGKAPAAK